VFCRGCFCHSSSVFSPHRLQPVYQVRCPRHSFIHVFNRLRILHTLAASLSRCLQRIPSLPDQIVVLSRLTSFKRIPASRNYKHKQTTDNTARCQTDPDSQSGLGPGWPRHQLLRAHPHLVTGGTVANTKVVCQPILHLCVHCHWCPWWVAPWWSLQTGTVCA
jgi:hypothetical protein